MADEKKWEGTQDIPAAEPETAAAPGAAEPLPPPEDGEMRMPARKRKLPRSKKRIAAIAAALCAAAAVEPGKVFPHNLRHLFARAFYRVSRDIARLADVLGHSSIETTRIYLLTTSAEHERTLERLNLVS